MRTRIRGLDVTESHSLLPWLIAILLLLPAGARAADPVPVGRIDTAGQPGDLAVQGRRIYLASGNPNPGLEIFDLDPAGIPIRLGGLTNGSIPAAPGGLMVRGTQVRFVDRKDITPYFTGIDASDPANPFQSVSARTRPFVDASNYGCVPFGANLLSWRAVFSEGIRPIVVAFSPPFPPGLIAFPPPVGLSSLVATATRPPFVYALGSSNLTVIDLSNPAWAQTISSLAIAVEPGFSVRTPIAADGGLVCIAKQTGGIVVVDVSDPGNPKQTAEIPTPTWVYDLALSGSTLVAAVGLSGAEVFDLSDPGAPTRSGLIADGHILSCVDVTGPFIIAGDLGSHELRVYQSNRTFPPRIEVPPSPQLASPADSVRFAVEAQGFGTLTYQWQHDGTNLLESATCRGVNAPELTLDGVTDPDAGAYRVIVSCLGESTTSLPATLAVNRLIAWGEVDRLGRTLRIALPQEPSTVGLSAGGRHDLALRTDGTIFAWGANRHGQTNAPANVTNAIAVAAGTDHSLALLTDGTVAAWGRNADGQTNVPSAATNVVAVAAGWAHSLALRADGTVVAWGHNEYGQCSVDVLASDVVAIAAGDYHSLALRADGRVIAWGLEAPAPDWATNAVDIAAGWGHSLARQADGTVLAWGDDTYGQSTVPETATNVVAIAAGFYHSLALRADGTVVAWGRNAFDMVNAAGSSAPVSLIDAGEDHSTSLLASGSVLVSSGPSIAYAASGGIATFSAQVRGRPPLTYQWLKDGEPVADATNRVVVIPAVEPEDAGLYQLEVSGPDGTEVSEPTLLTLVDVPPTVGDLPPRHQLGAGSPLRLAALAQGSQPLGYTWFWDEVKVPDATQRMLEIPSAEATASGSYWVVVSNAFGTATSTVSRVTVFPPTDPAEIALALDTTRLVWGTSPDAPWTLITTNTHDGVDSLRSGPIDGELESWVETTVNGPAVVQWSAQISGYAPDVSPTDATELRLEDLRANEDGVVDTLWTGSYSSFSGFQVARTEPLRTGTHRLRWTFLATTGAPDETKRGLLDDVRVQTLWPSLAARRGPAGVEFEVTWQVGWACALEYSREVGPNADWQTAREILMEHARVTFELPAPDAADAGFYRLRALP